MFVDKKMLLTDKPISEKLADELGLMCHQNLNLQWSYIAGNGDIVAVFYKVIGKVEFIGGVAYNGYYSGECVRGDDLLLYYLAEANYPPAVTLYRRKTIDDILKEQ